MKSVRRLCTLFLFLFCSLVYAQDRVITNEPIIWTQYTQNIKFSDLYRGTFAMQHRAFVEREKGYHLFFSAGVSRKLNHGFSVGAGFINLNINQFVDTDFVLVPELRPFQSIAFGQAVGKSSFSWRFMVEERFFRNAADGELVSGFNQNWRFRHKAQYNQYLANKLRLILSSEIMFNAGNININIFDQHRTQVMLGYIFGKLSASMGYMHWFFQTAANVHENRHTLIIAFAHSI